MSHLSRRSLHRLGLSCAVALLALLPSRVQAQTTSARWAASVGPQWLGRGNLGTRDAVESANPTGTLTLFRTESTLEGGIGISGGLAARLREGTWAEVAVAYHSATFRTRVTGDVEGSPDVVAVEGLQQYRVEGGLLWMPARWRLRRLRSFASGGAGYLRQLHGTGLLAETGRSYYAGGGVIVDLPRRAGGTVKSSGLRLEGRAVALDGGTGVAGGLAVAPALSAILFLGF